MEAATDTGVAEVRQDHVGDAQSDPVAFVVTSTVSKVRTFLYEIAEGTTNYRSLHSLTQQVEHQYHGRFLVELIQNAHDALHPDVGFDHGRIAIAMVDDDGPFGALYVANDGHPVSRSNFTSLSQLGQSDKDPQKSIGNKGIGFRSVLEISDSPQVFSRLERGSARFDGMCFGFSPQVLNDLAEPIRELTIAGVSPVSPFGAAPLVDWDRRLIEKFQRSALAKGPDWLAGELAYLSPYLLPVPLDSSRVHDRLRAFEADGYATVVRLPLKSDEARAAVEERIAQLPSDTVLFLDRVSSLILEGGGSSRRLLRAVTNDSTSKFARQLVQISVDDMAAAESYLIWGRTLVIAEAPHEIQAALAKLPGKWPELREARISVAVLSGRTPTVGLFSVFLPTLLETGSSAHVNAPFFADMSRTHIDFDKQGYNEGLLHETWKLALEIARDELAGGDTVAAGALIDLLAPTGAGPAAHRWRSGIQERLAVEAVRLSDQPWFLTDDGWSSLSVASLLPKVPNAKLFTEDTLRAHATFTVFESNMDSRAPQLTALADMAGYEVWPAKAALAATVEAIAAVLHAAGDVDWNTFWREVQHLLPTDAALLIGRRVLMGTDGQLHAAGDQCAVFFIPRHGAGEDDDVVSEKEIVGIPTRLQPHVAFLHSSITLYDVSNLRQQTPVRRYLEKTLVNRFRVEDIFNEVLIKRTPPLPVKLKGDPSELCADILQWGLSLLANLAGRGQGDKTIRMLKELALPCRGGWFKASTTSYGSGWPAPLGATLQRYLTSVRTADSQEASRRLLLPPRHALWREAGARHVDLLDTGGVATGLRLSRVEPSDWKATFTGSQGAFDLPQAPPPQFAVSMWQSYRMWVRNVHVPYGGSTFSYQVQSLNTVPGLSDFDRFSETTRVVLMQLLLGSMGSWPAGWDWTECKKMTGNLGPVRLRSPLWHTLTLLPWMGVHARDQLTWHRPSERWHVPAKLLGTRTWQFEHLHPLPLAVAHLLDHNNALTSILSSLGMPQYDPEVKSASTALLDALAIAAEAPELRDPNVFLGQLRGAWACFTPVANQSYPKKLIVTRGGRGLEAVAPSRDSPVYLPDSSRSSLAALEQFDIPVIAIEASDAKRLATGMVAAYGGAVISTSTLRVVPIADATEWQPADTQALHESTLHWIAPLALTLAAYYGPNRRGTGSQRFTAQIQALREVNVAWCQTLAVALFHGDVQVAQPSAAAAWIAERKTLLATTACEDDPRLLSEALATILERDDLEVALICLLRDLGADAQRPKIVTSLNELRLSEAQFLEVREQWTGNLRHVVDLLMPLIAALKTRSDPRAMLEAQTEEQLCEMLSAPRAWALDGAALITLARTVPDPFEFGLQCHQRFGEAVTLRRWNDAVVKLGGKPLGNRQAAAEFSLHASHAKQSLRSLLAFLVSLDSSAKSFREVLLELDTVSMPSTFVENLWEVRFRDTLSAFMPLASALGASPTQLQLLECCESVEALSAGLAATGVDVHQDPVRLARDNRDRLQRGLAQVQQIGLAWALKHDRAGIAAWEAPADALLGALDGALATDAYLHPWNDSDILRLLRALPHIGQAPAVSVAVHAATSLSELQQALGVSAEAIAGAAGQLGELKDQARRQSRMVDVCGQEFDGSEDNLAALWAHICNRLPDEAIDSLDAVDLLKPAKLDAAPVRKFGGGSGTSTRPPVQRPPRTLDLLVGMAGEIHAFRRLQHQYGATVVTSSSWISGNGALAFPENAAFANDGAGCDFRFTSSDGTTFHIEVKSSGADDATFTLGSSEVRLAMELARAKRRRQRERFVILRVLYAKSERPMFQVLQNPYDDRYAHLFEIIEAGARVRYRLANSGVKTTSEP
jgi:hypothetical protein